MARAYEVRPDQAHWANLNSIEAAHWRKLPGVVCPICGAWATTGIIYPSVDKSTLGGVLPSDLPSPMSVEQFERLAARIQPLLGAKRPVKPGADLGPLHGKARGTLGDFAWANPWTPLLRESVWLALREAGVLINGVHAKLDYGRLAHEPLIELEALPMSTLPTVLGPEKCETCGRLSLSTPRNITALASSFDGSVALQRIVELPTVLVANEPFAQFIQERSLRDVVLIPIEIP